MTGVDHDPRVRILFVDDDEAMLGALRSMLRRDLKRWAMVFAPSGAAALAELRKQHFDVVVSDMRMPNLDGAALLTQVKREFPHIARIMLSGFAEPEAIARALPALHQFLAKPCDGASLRATIQRSADATSGSGLALGRIDRVPSPRATLEAFARAIATGSVESVAEVVTTDPGLAAKILQLVSSTYFSTAACTTIRDAVAMLGLQHLECLRTTTNLFDPIGAAADEPWLEMWRARAERGARLARNACSTHDDAELAYSCALLRDVGRLVLAMDDPEYRALISVAASDTDLDALEAARYDGVTHAQLGGWLLGLWGLSPRLTEVVRTHHDPDTAPPELHHVAAAVYVGSTLAAQRDVDTAMFAGAARAAGGWLAEAT